MYIVNHTWDSVLIVIFRVSVRTSYFQDWFWFNLEKGYADPRPPPVISYARMGMIKLRLLKCAKTISRKSAKFIYLVLFNLEMLTHTYMEYYILPKFLVFSFRTVIYSISNDILAVYYKSMKKYQKNVLMCAGILCISVSIEM